MTKYESFIKIFFIIVSISIIAILLIKRFVYFRPNSIFIPYKEHYQDISEGNVHGWFVQGNNNKVVIICHGNAGNISHRQQLIDPLNQIGYSIIIFDYSGYGRSKGVPSEPQFYQDASVFAGIAMRQFDRNNIIVYGESIGAPVAVQLARKYGFNTIIIDSGLPSIKKYIKGKIPFLSFMSFLFSEFDTEKFLRGYGGNVLFMHSLTDEIIPYDITEIIRTLSTKIININGSHNNRIIPWDEVDKFIVESNT